MDALAIYEEKTEAATKAGTYRGALCSVIEPRNKNMLRFGTRRRRFIVRIRSVSEVPI